MKANQFTNHDEAQVGIGTMIVFIATILVAAVAAGVLIDTSQKLQDKSTQTGNDAISGVGSALTIEAVMGDRHASPTSTDYIDEVLVRVSLAAGADPVDLKDVVVQLQTDASLLAYTFDDGTPGLAGAGYIQEYGTVENYADIPDNKFWITPLRDTDSSLVDRDTTANTATTIQADYEDHIAPGAGETQDGYHGVLNDDDVVLILLGQHTSDTDLAIEESTEVQLSVVSGNGATAAAGFTTPDTYATQQFWVLF